MELTEGKVPKNDYPFDGGDGGLLFLKLMAAFGAPPPSLVGSRQGRQGSTNGRGCVSMTRPTGEDFIRFMEAIQKMHNNSGMVSW